MTVFTMDDLYRKMYDLKLLIRNILIKSKRTWDEPRGQIEYDTNDPDINQQYKEITDMFEAMENIANRIDLLNKPIKATSVLYKNSNNRYEDDVQEYSCGMGIEVLIPEINRAGSFLVLRLQRTVDTSSSGTEIWKWLVCRLATESDL